jgi:hypothetical protein
MLGLKTIAMPLLFDKKKAYSFSSFLVYVKVVPVADENFYVYSCSSDRIGLASFFSSSTFLPVLFLFVEPDLAEGANLIYLPGLLPILLTAGELYMESLFLLASSSAS